MANGLYAKGREGFLNGDISWRDGTIKVALLKATYVPAAGDKFVADIAAHIVARSDSLTTKTFTDGVADADDAHFAAIASGVAQATRYAIYSDTGSDATSRLIHLTDTAVALPFTPYGGELLVVWDNGANKIFKL